MRYRVRGLTVRSENAAKPITQPNKHVLRWIRGLPKQVAVLDVGCGKLRYTVPIAARVRKVVAIDSTLQLTRIQMVAGARTTVKDYAKAHLANVRVTSATDHTWRQCKYDYVLCANVLSAIPNQRTRVVLLKDLKNVLKAAGVVLIVVQFRNTYFRDFRKNPNAIPHHDGWLVRQGSFASFYGLISPGQVARLSRSAGLRIVRSSVHGESAFIWAGK